VIAFISISQPSSSTISNTTCPDVEIVMVMEVVMEVMVLMIIIIEIMMMMMMSLVITTHARTDIYIHTYTRPNMISNITCPITDTSVVRQQAGDSRQQKAGSG
jgi:hypothetical protein